MGGGRGRGGSYEAYLKDKPDLVFHLESKWVYVGEHAEYHNATDFSRVYGEYYLAEYQIERPLQYWQVVKDHWDQESFTLETVYDNPEGLEAAAAELLDFHAFLAEQCPEADVRYLFTFRSPVCPDRPSVSLGSGVVYLSAGAGDGAIRQEIGDLTAELAVWSVSYGLHPEWFSPEEMEQPWTTPRRRNTTARTSTSGHGLSPIRSGVICESRSPARKASGTPLLKFTGCWRPWSGKLWKAPRQTFLSPERTEASMPFL